MSICRQEPNEHLPALCPLLGFNGFLDSLRRNQQADIFLGFDFHPSAPHFRRQHQPQRFAQGAMAFCANLPGQFHQLRQQGGVVFQRRQNGLDFALVVIRRVLQANHVPLFFPGPERHPHPHAGQHVQRVRHPVGKYAVHLFGRNIHDDFRVQLGTPFFCGGNHSLVFLRTAYASFARAVVLNHLRHSALCV